MDYKYETTKIGDTKLEISAILSAESFATYEKSALDALRKNVNIDGFRPGNAPDDMVEKKVGTAVLLENMAQDAITAIYMEIAPKLKENPIGRPQITITKLAKGNPLEFKITTELMPEINLDLKTVEKVAKKVNKSHVKTNVTDEEFEKAFTDIRRMRTHQKMVSETPEGEQPKKLSDIKDDELMPVDDEWAKEVGKFASLDDLKTKIRENMQLEKDNQSKDKLRVELIDALIEESQIVAPELLIEYEMQKIEHQLGHDLAMQGLKEEDYLKQINKTKEELRTGWKEAATKRAQTHMILDYIAKTAEVNPSSEDVQKELDTIVAQYKDTANFSEANARAYVTEVLTNQKVFEYLEGLK